MISHDRRWAAALLMLAAATWTGCNADEPPPAANGPATAIQVGRENVVVVIRDTIVTGPIISGELRPQREATVRAQLGGSVLQLNVNVGQAVSRGAQLGRIEATSLTDARRSAEVAVRAAQNALTVSEREFDRTKQLVSAGALAARDLDMARNAVTTAEAQLADARSRLVTANQQLGDAEIRAPISGVVSVRSAYAGDIVSPGTPLFTIIDPSSMRLEAAVPSDDLGRLTIGASVLFTVRGYDAPFEGRIERISPVADPNTRQVPIFVTVPNVEGRLVAGLYAEGRVVNEAATGLVIPENAVNTSDDPAWVLRVTQGLTEKVTVTLGVRDPRTERVQVVAGVNEGDVLLRGSAQAIAPGTPVNVGVVAR